MNWIATVGITWDDKGTESRIEEGGTVPEALAKAAPWLIEGGYIVGGWEATAIPVVTFPPADAMVPQAEQLVGLDEPAESPLTDAPATGGDDNG
jgi:hypothetical protein